ncbi:uncharacterized protein LOC117644954 [Thrips palmi]|uniref:Uncharacterized protein LOC117644954 n=1 Tax=Thrips palmi TaxID=161013 RepID=A0A6P8YT92_THRPL|nr:uncharacterized protein LOC117644954 [Thrips palmi]
MARATAVLLAAASWLACGVLGAEPEWQNWESDVTESMGIGPSLTGYRQVSLRCAADHMEVHIEMEEDFDGVLYTRGAFYSQEKPCFLDAEGGRNFTLRLPFAKCKTRNDDNVYSNTIVVQYDDELIMPGDAAFKLECNFRKPKDFTVSAGLAGEPASSRISLEDADPAAQAKSKEAIVTATSDSSKVIFTPDSAKAPPKDEL